MVPAPSAGVLSAWLTAARAGRPQTLPDLVFRAEAVPGHDGDLGSLAIAAPSGPAGAIQISPAAAPWQRSHNVVRLRTSGPAGRYLAIFPGLPAGDYTVWHDRVSPAGTVTIQAGKVTEFGMPAPAGEAVSG